MVARPPVGVPIDVQVVETVGPVELERMTGGDHWATIALDRRTRPHVEYQQIRLLAHQDGRIAIVQTAVVLRRVYWYSFHTDQEPSNDLRAQSDDGRRTIDDSRFEQRNPIVYRRSSRRW